MGVASTQINITTELTNPATKEVESPPSPPPPQQIKMKAGHQQHGGTKPSTPTPGVVGGEYHTDQEHGRSN